MGLQIDWERVAALWAGSGHHPTTIAKNMYWARRFVDYCASRNRDPTADLTRSRATQIFARTRRRHRRHRGATHSALSAIHALSCALASLGHTVPAWVAPRQVADSVSAPLLREFVAYRQKHGGIARSTAKSDVYCATQFLGFLQSRGRRIRQVRVVDIDAFIATCAAHWALSSVRGAASSLRGFLRFLHATARIRQDLAAHVATPRLRSGNRPPRALPWGDVRRILRAVDLRRSSGRRDYVMLLMMAVYGMRVGEVCQLRLDDLDWRARTFHVGRSKTDTVTVLPLLDPVARALAAYIERDRPAHASVRSVFVGHPVPHGSLGSAAIWQRVHLHAAAAGVRSAFLGTHVFRHSNAVRHITAGTSVKIVSDILGHRRPSSTSVYVRASIDGLRSVALPVP
jgi:integrase/recombinase XerD